MSENKNTSKSFKIRYWPVGLTIILGLLVVIFLFYLPAWIDKTDNCTVCTNFYFSGLLLLLAGILFFMVFSYNKFIQYKRHLLESVINMWKEGKENERQKEHRENVQAIRESDRKQQAIQNFFRLAELCVTKEKKQGQYKAGDGKVYETEIEYREQFVIEKFNQLWEKYETLIRLQNS